MAKLTTENLVKVLVQSVKTPHWRKAMKAINASEDLAFNWRAQSIAAQKAGDHSSIFWMEYENCWDFWHAHAGRCRTQNVILHESAIRDRSLNGVEVIIRDASQRILYEERPEYIGKSDQYVMDHEFCTADEVAHYRLLLDEAGMPRPQVRIEFPPAPVTLAVLRQDKRYIEQIQHDVKVDAEIQVAKPLQRLPGEERPDIARLRKLAALPVAERRALLGASDVPRDSEGRRAMPTNGLPSPRDDNLPEIVKPSPYAAPYVPPLVEPVPPEPPPRPVSTNQKFDRAGFGRGEPVSGGFKVS